MNHLHNNCEGVDASVFSSDMLFDDERRSALKEYVARWDRAIRQHEAAASTPVAPTPIYVIVCQNDKPSQYGDHTVDDGGPIVWERYTRGATLEAAHRDAAQLERNNGACRVARLVFEDEPGFAS